MRIIHTADWHLGRLFHGVNLLEDQSYVLEDLVRLIKESKPDVLLISGDVYDRSLPPAEAVSLLGEFLTRMCLDAKVPVIMIAGNHDNPERLGFAQEILGHQGIHIVGLLNDFFRPVILEDKTGPVYFSPIPYCEPAFARSFLQDENIRDHNGAMASLTSRVLNNIPPGARRIGLAHALVIGGQESESERPLSVVGGAGAVNREIFKDFHYLALGHLHRPQSMNQHIIRYAGSLLKYSFSEVDHQKSVTLLEIDELGHITRLDEVTLGCRRNMRVLEGTLAELFTRSKDDCNKEDYIKVILKDQGALFDPLGKLRTVYPNVLDLERPMLLTAAGKGRLELDHRKMNDIDLFSSFFDQVGGETLSERERSELTSLLDGFYYQERGIRE